MIGRRRASAFICAFICVQLGLPTAYYLSDNPYDERFAWRMFSPTRMAGCQVSAQRIESGRSEKIRLQRHIHVVWYNLLKRARPSVIDKVSQHLCSTLKTEQEDIDIRLSLQCGNPANSAAGICLNHRDRDSDGLPDGYANTLAACGHLSPQACYQRDCGTQTASSCYRALCRTQVISPDQNICQTEVGI